MSYRDFALKALTNKYLALVLRLYIGGIFIYASIYKIIPVAVAIIVYHSIDI